MEQVLIQYKVPFDILFDEQLGWGGPLRAIVLAGRNPFQTPRSGLFLGYVRNGGTLILAGKYGPCTTNGASGGGITLCSRHGAKARGGSSISHASSRQRQRRQAPTRSDPEPGATLRRTARMSPAQWVLPQNHQEIYKTIADSLPSGLSIQTEAPLTTVMELLTRPRRGRPSLILSISIASTNRCPSG